MVWLTSEKPCSSATSAAHFSAARPRPRRWRRRCGTPGDGDGAPSTAGTPIRRCRCAGCRRRRRPPSSAGCGRRWSARCPRRAGAIRRAVPAPSGTRRRCPVARRWRRAVGWRGPRCLLTAASGLLGVGYRVEHDIGQVVVDEPVHAPRAGAFTGDDAGGLEDAQVLADQWLRYLQRVDQFVHAARRLVQLQHDRDAHGGGQGAQDFAGGVEDLARRRGGEWRFDCAGADLRRWWWARDTSGLLEIVFSYRFHHYMHDRACQRLRRRPALTSCP